MLTYHQVKMARRGMTSMVKARYKNRHAKTYI